MINDQKAAVRDFHQMPPYNQASNATNSTAAVAVHPQSGTEEVKIIYFWRHA